MFDKTNILGIGSQATVYLQDGYAYKVFRKDYPQDWISYEKKIMHAVSKTKLAVPHCYEYEDSNVIKMDYIDGITLAERMRKEKYKCGVEDLIELQKTIHPHECKDVPSFTECAKEDLERVSGFEMEKEQAKKYLEMIEEKNCLLHLDFHFLNVLYTEADYQIIDWINAKMGNPVYDLARTYVILNEKAYRASRKYLSLIKKDKELDLKDFDKAVLVMALLRIMEEDTDKTRQLIKEYFEITS